MKQIKEDIEMITEEFEYSNDKSWDVEAKEFFWARQLNADKKKQ